MAAAPETPPTAEVTDVAPDDAARRLTLALARFIGGGYLAYFAVCMPEMSADATLVAPWWTPTAVVLAFGPGWALLVATFAQHWDRWFPVLAWASALGYLLAVGLWFVAWTGVHAPDHRATWLVMFPGLASLTLTLVRPRFAAVLYLPIAGVSVLVANALGRSTVYGSALPLPSVLWSLTFSLVFVLAATMAMRTGAVLDTTRERASQLAAEASAELARNLENARYDDLIHDRVLAVLLNVTAGRADHQAATQARQALDSLDDDADGPSTDMNVDDLVSHLASSVRAIDSAVAVTGPVRGGAREATVAGPVAEAFTLAACEAVRNARRHAGGGAEVRIDVQTTGRAVSIRIADDGVGFDTAAVGEDRMGLEFSIGRRMTTAGGRATVNSTVGTGTEVLLEWPR